MDRAKLKLMVRNLELLVDDIKSEVFSDVESYVSPPPKISQDYDEILEMMMATRISRAKRLVKMLKRVLEKDYLYNDEELKLIREQLKIAKNELARIEEHTSKGFK